jgi:hypothetical protein
MKRILMGLGALAVIVTAGLAGGSILEQNRFNREMELLRDALQHARFSVDSCKMSLAQEEYRFLVFDEFVDSLHSQLRELEDPSQGGVPQARYPEYLGIFDRYNDSVAVWEARSDALRATDAACRELVVGHNALGDSLRQRLEMRREEG